MEFSKALRWHFSLVHVVPWLSVPVVSAATPWLPLTTFEVLLLLSMWFLTGCLGVSVGFHRHFSHHAFEAAPGMRATMAWLGHMAGQGPLIYWVSLHRKHHRFTDVEGDPHSPISISKGRLKALVHGHIGWILTHEIPSAQRYAVDLLRDRVVRQASEKYYAALASGILLPALIGGLWHLSLAGAIAGALWGGFLRLALGNHVIWAVNSICHCFGSRPYATKDRSTNNALVALLSFGEGWHNNHHHAPTSARLGRVWWQIDVAYWVIVLMRLMGLARSVRVSLSAESTTAHLGTQSETNAVRKREA